MFNSLRRQLTSVTCGLIILAIVSTLLISHFFINLPIKIVKIDKTFINHLNDTSQLQVVGLIIDLGHSLGMSIVAEGVETQEQLRILAELGCDYIQGYVCSRPVPEVEAVKLLSADKPSISGR